MSKPFSKASCRALLLAGLGFVLAPNLALAQTGDVQTGVFKTKDDQIWNDTDNFKIALSKPVTLNHAGTGCVLVRFSANALVEDLADPSPSPSIEFKVVINGMGMAPGTLFFQPSGDAYFDNFAGDWWRCGLAGSGTDYTVKIKYRRRPSQAPGDSAQLRERTLVVQYGQ